MINESDNIQNIIRGCLNDDRKSQEHLYRSFYRVMMNLCLRYTKNEEEALEVLNTGFYKVYRNIKSYDEKRGSLYTWIRTIIVNSCIDQIKSRQSFGTTESLDSISPIQIQAEVITKLAATEILDHVRKLPPATQAVFNLYVIEGFSHKEISNIAGISEGTSKWHLNEARKKLKQMISNAGNE